MALWLAVLVLLAANVVSVTGMLLLRRRAPSGSYFKDTQQAAGVFAVAGTTFAVLVAFTFFLAFQSYDRARTSAQDEATATAALFHDTELFSPGSEDVLRGDLICYARAVVHLEWPAMGHDRESQVVNGWIARIERAFDAIAVRGARSDAAFSNWFDRTQDRAKARRGRLAEAAPFVPGLVWVFLILGGVVVVTFVGFFADPRERSLSQGMLMVAVTTMVAASLLMVHFFDSPYTGHAGSVKPSAMRETLGGIQAEALHLTPGVGIPCDARGRPNRAAPA